MNDVLTAGGGEEGRRRPLLDHLPTRQRLTTKGAQRHSATVRRLRIALPVFALALVVALLLNSRPEEADSAFLDDFADVDATAQKAQAVRPSFAGVDDRGQPYEVTAEQAVQTAQSADVVELVQPKAISRGKDAQTEVAAHKGFYDQVQHILDLSGGVTLLRRIGSDTYRLAAPDAKVLLKSETVESVSGVEGEGEGGTLRADRMRAYDAESRVVFEGNVSMRIYPGKLKDGADRPDRP
jgi:lipopolysaccharide export system protein LptC